MVMSLVTYVYTIYRGGFVIDDHDGIEKYPEKLESLNYYHLMKFFWWKMAGKSARLHHSFSVFLQMGVCGMLYLYIEPLFGSNIAFLTTLLFAVHPINNQSVAWVSGRGYPLGLFFLLIALQVPKLAIFYPVLETFSILKYLLFSVFFLWATVSQFTIMATPVILFYQGETSLGILATVISLLSGAWFIKQTIQHRSKTFKEQAMGDSTHFHLKKLIIVIKTLAYYTQLCFFPAHMGIYHKWGYHYGKHMEKEDTLFWLGLLLFGAITALFHFGPFVVKFGILWYLAYLFIFLNWITIHQFVSERYCYIANIGLCLIAANFLINSPILSAFIIGLMLMRTWQHLPTYCDQIRFYLSNIWNFPDSEVAMANLGVILMRAGLTGMATDYWMMATKVNPGYDVPWYNMYSTFKMRGQFPQAREYLVNAISSPTCHFKDNWTKELNNFDRDLIANKHKMGPGQMPMALTGKFINSSGQILEITSENLTTRVHPQGQEGKVDTSNLLSKPTT